MNDVQHIAERVEAKLQDLEDRRKELAKQIEAKRARIRQVEVTLEKLRELQTRLN